MAKFIYRCTCPLCGKQIESTTAHVQCECGLKLFIKKWKEKDYERMLYPVFEALCGFTEDNK